MQNLFVIACVCASLFRIVHKNAGMRRWVQCGALSIFMKWNTNVHLNCIDGKIYDLGSIKKCNLKQSDQNYLSTVLVGHSQTFDWVMEFERKLNGMPGRDNRRFLLWKCLSLSSNGFDWETFLFCLCFILLAFSDENSPDQWNWNLLFKHLLFKSSWNLCFSLRE